MKNAAISIHVLGPIETNCYLITNSDTKTKETIIVDPTKDGSLTCPIRRYCESHGLTPVAVLLTHGHFDHFNKAEELRDYYNIPVYAGEDEVQLLSDPALNLSCMLDYSGGESVLTPCRTVKDGQMLHLAGLEIKAISTPGHTLGGICYYFGKTGKAKALPFLMSGDTLFKGSHGRIDFPTGDYETLMQSLRHRLFILPGETIVYPGHGETTSITAESARFTENR